jgi:energy-coupling factor transporter ATP-binding protein EcfA2
MFKSMRLKNFKAFKDTGDVPLAPLTIVIGPNNSGKSTLLQSISVLAQTVWRHDNLALDMNGDLVQLNGYYDIVFGGRNGGGEFGISLTLDREDGGFQLPKELRHSVATRLDVSFALSQTSKEIVVVNSEYWKDQKRVVWIDQEKVITSNISSTPFKIKGDLQKFLIQSFDPANLLQAQGVSKDTLEGQALSILNHLLMMSAFAWRANLADILHIRERQKIPWLVPVGGSGSGRHVSFNLINRLGNKDEISASGDTILNEVNKWISDRFQILKKLHIESLDESGTVRMLLGFDGLNEINVAAMGEGISQIIPIIADSVRGPELKCLMIEQPEIHLHPKLQADLGDMFIEYMQTMERQFIIETHSEHLLLRIRRRIAEGKLKPEQVAILFVEKSGAESKVRKVELNTEGRFTDWPEGFFDQAYEDVMGIAQAPFNKTRVK